MIKESDLIVKISNSIKECLKDNDIELKVGEDTGFLREESKDLILYAKIKIKK